MRSSRFSWIRTLFLLSASWLPALSPASATGQLAERSPPPLQDKVSLSIARALHQRRSLSTLLEHGLPNPQQPVRCSLGLSISRATAPTRCALEVSEHLPPSAACVNVGLEWSCKNL
jgi:hypothetical protein